MPITYIKTKDFNPSDIKKVVEEFAPKVVRHFERNPVGFKTLSLLQYKKIMATMMSDWIKWHGGERIEIGSAMEYKLLRLEKRPRGKFIFKLFY